MYRFPIPCLVAALLAHAVACTGEAPAYRTEGYPFDRLESDFDRYVDLVYRDHPLTFTDREVLERTIDTQRNLLRDGMTEFEFYAVVAPVGAAVRCGHTRTYLSEGGHDYLQSHGQCLPFEIRILDGGLYVYKDFTPEGAVAGGSRVWTINGHAARNIIERMRASVPADGINVTYKDYGINLRFSRLFTLLYGGTRWFELEVSVPGSGDEVVGRIVAAQTPDENDRVDGARYPSPADCPRLCTAVSEDQRYAVLTIRDFGYYGEVDRFRKPAGDFFARMASEGIDALIIDLRGNDGGDPYCSSFVASHLISEPVRYFAAGTPVYSDLVRPIRVPENVFAGELFVLVDGWCFSSTAHLLSLLRCHRRGVFVGEESGGSSVCNDASREHVLEHTGLRLNLPRRSFATSAGCLPPGRGIPPDVGIRPTIDDLVEDRDVVLEKAVSLVGSPR